MRTQSVCGKLRAGPWGPKMTEAESLCTVCPGATGTNNCYATWPTSEQHQEPGSGGSEEKERSKREGASWVLVLNSRVKNSLGKCQGKGLERGECLSRVFRK